MPKPTPPAQAPAETPEVPVESSTPEPTTPTPAETPTEPTEDSTEAPEPKPTETVDYWKQHARSWENRAKENHAAAKKLPEAETAAAEATTRADTAEARTQALTIALEHHLTAADVDLLIGAGDETKMQALAARLSTGSAPYVPDQGTDHALPKPDKQREFVRGLFNRND